MLETLVAAAYLGAAILFILTLRGLSHQETAKLGNLQGIVGMALAIGATLALIDNNIGTFLLVMLVGGTVGLFYARRVQMRQMPEFVAILHSLVGLAAVLVGFGNMLEPVAEFVGTEKTINLAETSIGVLIGGFTFTGSLVAYLKLSARMSGEPMDLPFKHGLNLIMAILCVVGCVLFVGAEGNGAIWLIFVFVISMLLGAHIVLSIGGADMPVVISMLNSYSGWAASAMGFMLSNDLLILTGALVGSSGAILSYIMCRAMNRNFISVISGGFWNQ